MSALWAIYVPGPDEYHAMPSRDAAEIAARQHNNSGCIEHNMLIESQSAAAAAALATLGGEHAD